PPLRKSSTDGDRVREIERYAKQKLDEFLREQHPALPPLRTQPRWSLTETLEQLRDRVQILFRKTVTLTKVAVICLAVAFLGLIVAFSIQAHRPVAIIADSTDAEWRSAKESEAVLYRGWHYLEAGYARIDMRKGAEVLLQAPCALELTSSNELYLESGSLCAKVPQRAQGFTVETSSSKIVDYGTEFGAMVGGDQQVEVHVFKGGVGVGTKAVAKALPLQKLSAGNAAVLSGNRNIQVRPLAERTRLFARSLPNEGALGIPGKRIDLADLVGNGNGFGTGQIGHGIDLSSGQFVPVQVIASNTKAEGYVSLPDVAFIDGVFIPDGAQTGKVTISSTGLVFEGCPDTRGHIRGYLINGAIFGGGDQDIDNSVHFGALQGRTYGSKQLSSIGMHANAGITFDLDAIRRSVQDRHLARFTALGGISETAGHNFDGFYGDGDDRYRVTVDFWILVDGQVQFYRRLNAVPSEPAAIDVELPPSARFLTLMTTDSQTRTAHCWGMFAQPVLELAKP
ncbi:FecR domain-containing protein, partial [Planctomycetota bacterium]